MQIKPLSASQAAATASQPARTTAAAGKCGDFAQMLKTAQADAPAATTATPAAAANTATSAQARS